VIVVAAAVMVGGGVGRHALAWAQAAATNGMDVPQTELVQPAELAAMLKGADKPVVVQVGPKVMYDQGHIPGAMYGGAAGQASGRAALDAKVKTLARDKVVVLYCEHPRGLLGNAEAGVRKGEGVVHRTGLWNRLGGEGVSQHGSGGRRGEVKAGSRLTAVLLVVASIAAWGQKTGGAALVGGAGLVGKPAPGFSRADLDGRIVQLKSFRGKVVLLNFWATWCGPCLVEMPRFVEWQRDIKGLQVVGVAMDDDAGPVKKARTKYGLNYPVVMGDAALGKLYGGVYGLPVTLVVDTAGVVRFRHRGADDLEELKREVEGLQGK
jgi:thiol-disulfide isomerase/thioredoxin/rhodanese-related sulfurtransferase